MIQIEISEIIPQEMTIQSLPSTTTKFIDDPLTKAVSQVIHQYASKQNIEKVIEDLAKEAAKQKPIEQSIEQPVDQSIKQSIEQSIEQFIEQSIEQPKFQFDIYIPPCVQNKSNMSSHVVLNTLGFGVTLLMFSEFFHSDSSIQVKNTSIFDYEFGSFKIVDKNGSYRLLWNGTATTKNQNIYRSNFKRLGIKALSVIVERYEHLIDDKEKYKEIIDTDFGSFTLHRRYGNLPHDGINVLSAMHLKHFHHICVIK